MPPTPPTAAFHPEQRMAQLLAMQRQLHTVAAQLRPLGPPASPHLACDATDQPFEARMAQSAALPPSLPRLAAH